MSYESVDALQRTLTGCRVMPVRRETLLINPTPELEPARHAFLASYSGTSSTNRFTKVRMDARADESLQTFFKT